jgi:3-oxoacyl-[acyl-carrier protein] reductase
MLNVVVTGGSRGLGLGITHKLAMAGYSVIAIARRESEQLASVIRDVEHARQGVVHFRSFDLDAIAEIPDLVSGLRTDFGAIYGLVNNAALGTSGLLATMHNAQIERTVRLNTVSPLVLTKYVVRSMMAGTGGGGRIINISSIVGFTGYSGAAVYGATKAAILGFTRSLAREVGALGINVNAIAPGFIDTEMTRGFAGPQREQIARRSALRRTADVDDIANAVRFLLGDQAKNITGTVLTVDAGSTA